MYEFWDTCSSIKGGVVNESLTKIPLKTANISQKSSFSMGGQSDFSTILGGGGSIWSPDLGGVYTIVTLSMEGISCMKHFKGGSTICA